MGYLVLWKPGLTADHLDSENFTQIEITRIPHYNHMRKLVYGEVLLAKIRYNVLQYN